MRVRTHRFNGIKYHIRLAKDCDGSCDAPRNGAPMIAIFVDLKDKNGLETVIHEALHAGNFDKSETKIDQTSSDLAGFLWRLGYRRKI